MRNVCLFWQSGFKSSLLNQDKRFPGGSVVKNLSSNAGDMGLIPGSRRSPGEENSNLLQYSCLGPRGLVGYSPWGHKRVGRDLETKEQQTKTDLWVCSYSALQNLLPTYTHTICCLLRSLFTERQWDSQGQVAWPLHAEILVPSSCSMDTSKMDGWLSAGIHQDHIQSLGILNPIPEHFSELIWSWTLLAGSLPSPDYFLSDSHLYPLLKTIGHGAPYLVWTFPL